MQNINLNTITYNQLIHYAQQEYAEFNRINHDAPLSMKFNAEDKVHGDKFVVVEDNSDNCHHYFMYPSDRLNDKAQIHMKFATCSEAYIACVQQMMIDNCEDEHHTKLMLAIKV